MASNVFAGIWGAVPLEFLYPEDGCEIAEMWGDFKVDGEGGAGVGVGNGL